VSAARLKFYQRTPRQIQGTVDPGLEAEIAIGDLTLCVYRFTMSDPLASLRGSGHRRKDEHVSVKVELFTDQLATFRRLDKMRVFNKIERAKLRDSDDLARLLVACGLRHVPFAGYQYEPDGGASEKRRIKNLHSS
jgi:hypothetical protein